MTLLDISIRTRFIDDRGEIVTVYTSPKDNNSRQYATQVFGGQHSGYCHSSTGIHQARLVHKRTILFASKINTANMFQVGTK